MVEDAVDKINLLHTEARVSSAVAVAVRMETQEEIRARNTHWTLDVA